MKDNLEKVTLLARALRINTEFPRGRRPAHDTVISMMIARFY